MNYILKVRIAPDQMPAATIDYILAATLRATGLTYDEIAQQLGAKAQSIRVGLSRRGLNKPATLAREGVIRRAVETAEMAIQQASKDSRTTLSDAIARDVDWLNEAPATRNDKAVFIRYSRLAPVVAMAEKVYGWRADDTGPATVNLSRINIHYASSDHDSMPASIGSNSPVDGLQEERLQRDSVIDATLVSAGQVSPVAPLQEPSIDVASQVDATTPATLPGDSPPSAT